jgi:hypothetical protein
MRKAAWWLAATCFAAAAELGAAPLGVPESNREPAHVVMYVDLTGMAKDAQEQVLNSAKKFLRNHVPAKKMGAILTYNGRFVVVRQDFTADLERLGRALDQIAARTTEIQQVSDEARAIAFETALEMVRAQPGNKDLVFYVPRPLSMDQQRLDRIMDMASKAGVNFYAMDSSGHVALPLVR